MIDRHQCERRLVHHAVLGYCAGIGPRGICAGTLKLNFGSFCSFATALTGDQRQSRYARFIGKQNCRDCNEVAPGDGENLKVGHICLPSSVRLSQAIIDEGILSRRSSASRFYAKYSYRSYDLPIPRPSAWF